MQHRSLGKTGLSIAPLVFGGNVFGWTADENTSFDLLAPASMPSTRRMSIRAGCRAMKAVNRRRSSANG
jgi:hypothetical protein